MYDDDPNVALLGVFGAVTNGEPDAFVFFSPKMEPDDFWAPKPI